MATVTKRIGSYFITVSCGYDCEGKQVRQTMTWKPEPGMTKKQEEKELQRQTVLFEERVKTGQFISSNIRFSEFAERWFKDYAEKQLKPHTIAQYNALIDRINKCIGHIRLDKLQPHHLLAFYNELEKEGIRHDKKYKSKVDFKAYLKENKITKVKLSELSGVSICTLDSVTTGKNISEKTMLKICNALCEKQDNIFVPVNDNAKLSGKTIKHHHCLISSILSTAVQWQVIAANPCDRIKPPKAQRKDDDINYLDEKQAAQLLEALNKEDIQNRTMIQMLIFIGMRRGELLGLKWDDIDFDNSLISINRSIQYLPGKGIFESDTKTTSSQRVIKASAFVMDILKEFKLWQTKQRLLLGDRWNNTGYIFTKYDGTPMNPDSLSSWFSKFIKENDLPPITLHGLRHTNATLQIASHVPLTTVANRLGHANTATTTKIYAHAIRSADEAAAETLQDILAPGKLKEA